MHSPNGIKTISSSAAGPTVFAPFKQDSDYFSVDKAFMINFRVEDLAELPES